MKAGVGFQLKLGILCGFMHKNPIRKSWQQNQKISATEQFAALSAMKEDSFVEITQRFQPISLLWFFLLFLAGSAFLWLERKI